MQNLW